MSTPITVIIVGAGLGGLALTQSLRSFGIEVLVFERDHGPFDRPQGYRLHLDADGIQAVREVLPPDLRRVFEATSFRTEPFTTILRPDLTVAKRLPTADERSDVWPDVFGPPEHVNVDRATLRQILLAGLDDYIHYDRTLERYEDYGDGVVAHFTDGASVRGDVLVGADGIGSAVRRQRAPQALTMDAGVTAIYGRVPLDVAAGLAPPETLGDIFTIASDERKVFLGAGAVRFPQRPEVAATSLAPGAEMRPQDDYVVCIVGGRHEQFPDLRGASPAELQRIAAATVDSWGGPAAALVRAGDPDSFFSVAMRSSVPIDLDTPSRITLLGDAVHAMTPTLGRGANLAMRDGALLGRALRAIVAGEQSLADALVTYEHAMLAYGFAVVREAAAVGEQRMAQNPLPN